MSDHTTTNAQLSELPPLVPLIQAGVVLGLTKPVTYALRRSNAFPLPVLQVGSRKFYVRRVDLETFVNGTAA